ncbi:hypothetical protein ACIHJG_34175 [Streptomyces sp. NPDC052415]|uniref:hypothetical protein n=1 Tax=Streptomyces sp. NPDC052415 TaxID=3365690 RepID=UPI0037D26B8E
MRPYIPHPPAFTPVRDDTPRIAAADFFTRARSGRAATALPPYSDGDCVSCPDGNLWVRHHGQWITPGQPDTLTVSDRTVTGWWWRRDLPGGRRFALVHRLTPDELGRIAAPRYLGRYIDHIDTPHECLHQRMVTGTWLQHHAAHVTRSRTTSVHLELPSGIVTVHSRTQGDIFYHPTRTPHRP